jgi:hypothetical protein
MPTRYTAVFEWDGEAPAVGAGDGWLGGRLVRLSLEEEASMTAGLREFHEVVIDGRTYRTTSQKLVDEIQRQDLEIQEMNGRLIAANRTLQNVRGQLATAQRTVDDIRLALGTLSDDEADSIIAQTAPWVGPDTRSIVRRVVEVSDNVRGSRLPAAQGAPEKNTRTFFDALKKREAPDDAPGLADALGRAAILEEEHRYLSSALVSRCGPRKVGESWVDYARRTMGKT